VRQLRPGSEGCSREDRDLRAMERSLSDALRRCNAASRRACAVIRRPIAA